MTVHHYPRRTSRRRAFTLIELIVVVIIIAVLAAIGSVAYNQFVAKARGNAVLASAVGLRTALEARAAGDDMTVASETRTLWTGAGGDSAEFLHSVDAAYTGSVAYSPATDGAPADLQVTDSTGNQHACITLSEPPTVTRGACVAASGPTGTPTSGNSGGASPAVEPASIVAGGSHTCAVSTTGSLYCWGYAIMGQVGIAPPVSSQPSPAQVGGLLASQTVTAVTAGDNDTCALATGSVYCWGANLYGEVGDTTTTERDTPVQVGGLLAGKSVTAVSAGNYHVCAIAYGSLYCWGSNDHGQLGDNTTNNSATPELVGGPLAGKTVTAVSGGDYQTCAIADGALYCWGGNLYGQVGDGTGTNQSLPVPVGGLLAGKTVSAVDAGGMHTCAIASGALYCWGVGGNGQLGDGASGNQMLPELIGGPLTGKTVTAVSGGSRQTCAIADDAVYCWGYNYYGQLGDGGTTDSHIPELVGSLTGTATAVTSGGYQTCALVDGSLYCWGRNQFGQVGDGGTTDQHSPVTATL